MLSKYLNFSFKIYESVRTFSSKGFTPVIKPKYDGEKAEGILLKECAPQVREIRPPPDDCSPITIVAQPFVPVCLPKIETKLVFPPDCPEPCEPPPGPLIPLCRRKKRPIVLPKPKPCKIKFICPDRADEKIEYKRKQLPVIEANKCPCIEDFPLKDAPPLRRLEKLVQVQSTFCPVPEKCLPVERADHGLKIIEKTLPCLKPGHCPCIEHQIHDVPPLKRLTPKPIIMPERICKEPDVCEIREKVEPPYIRKTLPILKPSNCPCIEEKIQDVCPLPRLPKVLVCPEPIPLKCIKIDCAPRADEMCGYKIKEKTLPTMLLCESLNKVSLGEYHAKKQKRQQSKAMN